MTKYLDERSYSQGDTIFSEGEQGSDMFIVQQGRVVVSKHVGSTEVVLATLERGDFFGEMSLLESVPRSATCRALAPTKVVVIRTGELLLKIRRDPTFAFEMLQHMSRRIRYLDEQLVKLVSSEDVSHTAKEALTNARASAEFPPHDGLNRELAKTAASSATSPRFEHDYECSRRSSPDHL